MEVIAIGKIVILSVSEGEEDIIEKVLEVVKASNIYAVSENDTSCILQVDKLKIDSRQHIVLKENQEVNLTNIEFQILHFLALHKGMVMSKEQIYENVWNGEYLYDDSNITSHIRRLRVKIEDDPANPKYIQTVRGIGYEFNKNVYTYCKKGKE